jgi:enamine deaminase RidA (YjgF/YER057c/UK114 family)
MSKERINFSSKSVWEPLRGYSRAVQVGEQLFISGTTAVDAKGEVVAPNEPYEQTRFVINRIREILSAAGFKISDVVRTRLFVTNLSRWEDYAKAHRDAFETIRPASSIVQVARLVDPRLTIEMEVEAIRGVEVIDSRLI